VGSAFVGSAIGRPFVILLLVDEGIENPLPTVPAFREFQENLKSWIADRPVPESLTVVGVVHLF
jgi:hypothetical protein